jgi:hypothetical protein
MRKDLTGDEFIDENPAVLRVILKLNDVVAAVVGFEQMRLRSASHLPDEAAGVHSHRVCRNRKFTTRESIT